MTHTVHITILSETTTDIHIRKSAIIICCVVTAVSYCRCYIVLWDCGTVKKIYMYIYIIKDEVYNNISLKYKYNISLKFKSGVNVDIYIMYISIYIIYIYLYI